ncbi:MAG: hypothetical protein NXY57DRAFT_459592 [Lentinula lateritia]|uniref:Secreted protein n=1 Tax=Lentinula lateritia TaxID=40482 RepID=A0ABQ8VEQ8_9AGAR|nr:MAG: hypothetical protein NXY57DRAFT_459592 [Lentinula lateritia]KAJ4489078.1 hypothetical protein C8R41DRAFT_835837 [Lentinula lateritia]
MPHAWMVIISLFYVSACISLSIQVEDRRESSGPRGKDFYPIVGCKLRSMQCSINSQTSTQKLKNSSLFCIRRPAMNTISTISFLVLSTKYARKRNFDQILRAKKYHPRPGKLMQAGSLSSHLPAMHQPGGSVW